MPRANRHFLPGHVCHLTRCRHHKAFLLKFARDRRRFLGWVFAIIDLWALSLSKKPCRLRFRRCDLSKRCNWHRHCLVPILLGMNRVLNGFCRVGV